MMRITKRQLRRIIKEEIEQVEPRTGGWDKRDLQTFFDRLEGIVYHSAQWQTVEEAQKVIQDIGKEAITVRAGMEK